MSNLPTHNSVPALTPRDTKASIREHIAAIIATDIDQHVESGGLWGGLKAADAITDALPDMIALVWPVFSEGQVWQSAKPLVFGEVYSIRLTKVGWQAYYGDNVVSLRCPTPEQAKAAAKIHLSRAIAKLLKG